ncbi:LiaF domain-containing protein [Oceanobacillus sp. Castelsardo]|uniref:LiaF transmembrane domain-containing protein n=1 Tax=Oceanobacillus sp. Castelsardo TaxID=1851204 RepID=UPI00083846BB|nr:LiaF domain-containing protein [Oceanobacillus sp. Castelsardo]
MSGRIWVGLFFLMFGFGFLLHQADIINMSQVLSTWWPFIFIIIGIIQLTNRSYASTVSGFLFLLIGIIFLANQWYDLNLIFYLWPLVFIFIGLVIILTRVKNGKTSHTSERLNTFLLFSGAEIKSQSKNFHGGSVMTLCGGVEIDLREAIITERTTLDLTCIMGGASIIVPENVRVETSGIPIFGGWEDNTRSIHEVAVLKINCLMIFGGAEIKN